MARYQKQRNDYPMGSVSCGTMRPEDLIPTFTYELEYRLKHGPGVSRETRKSHFQLVRDANAELNAERPDPDVLDEILSELFDALGEYAGPYFYFGAHPGDGADYGYWLSESWDGDFISVYDGAIADDKAGYRPADCTMGGAGLKVSDLSEVPTWFRGEVAVVNDHGNVTLYVKTARGLREIWAVV